MNFKFFLTHALFFGFTVSGYLNCNIVVKFSKAKLITKGTIFTCLKPKETIILSKCLMKNYLQYTISSVNITQSTFENLLVRTQTKLGVVLDTDCENWNLRINGNCDKKYFYETYNWLITANFKNITEQLSLLKLNINSDMHLVPLSSYNEEKKSFIIFDVYNPASEHGGEIKVEEIGVFYKMKEEEEGSYNITNFENKYWTRKNMTGVSFKSAIVIPQLTTSLDNYLASDEDRRLDSMHRFQSVTIQNCQHIYNFGLSIERTDSWGYVQADGKFDGLVSLLERKLVDFGSSPLLFKLDRMPFVDYGYGNWILRSCFIYQRPKVTATSYEIFLRPLEMNVWMLIIIMFLVVLILMKIVFSSELLLSNKKKRIGLTDSSWSFLVLFVMGAFCMQGATCNPFLISSRILAIFIFMFCILIYQFYSASIVSYLLLDPPRTIFNLKDLLDSSLQVGVEDILIDRNYFIQTTDPDAIDLFELKIKNGNNNSGFYSPAEGLELVRRGGFAFHVETSTAYPIIEETFSNQQICELEEVQMYRTQPMYTNLQKHSPFREMMNYCMFKQAENGNMDRLRKYWDARQPTCIQGAKKQELNVSFKEFSCGPLAVACGILMGMVFLIYEYMKFNKKKLISSIKSSLYFGNGVVLTYPFIR